MPPNPSTRPLSTTEPDWVPLVRAHVENLRFGVVQLVVHDGRVTQIERTEKLRLPAKGDPSPQL
jgi:hypothetical protein